MNIGIFDSGLGGLLVTQAITKALPEYDYIYLGDTKRVPYGNHSQETVYEFTRQAVEWLFAQDCALVVLACNTASAEALRRIQQEYLPATFPNRRVLGVIIPTVEAVRSTTVGVLATRSTVASDAYGKELRTRNSNTEIKQVAAPLLVPLVENDGRPWARPILQSYLQQLGEVESLILGCTHYSAYKDIIREMLPKTTVLCQDELVPQSLALYLERHPEIAKTLGRNGNRRYCLTEVTDWTGKFLDIEVPFEKITL